MYSLTESNHIKKSFIATDALQEMSLHITNNLFSMKRQSRLFKIFN